MKKNLVPAQPWDLKKMIQYTSSYVENPSEEIKPEFIDTLLCYSQLVNNQIEESYSEITKVLNSVQANPFLCKDQDVADNLADTFLSFIMSEKDDQVQWASYQIIKANPIKNPNYPSKIPQQSFASAILNYPKQYFQTLSTDSLLKISTEDFDQSLIPYLILELEHRGINDYSSDIIFKADPSQLPPKLFVKYFSKFIDSPTLSIASQIFNCLREQPTLHLLCVKEATKYSKQNAHRALEMIGNRIEASLPLQFPLSFLYHPSISEFIDVVEESNGNPDNSNESELLEVIERIGTEIIPFLIPFFLEFPSWLELIRTINTEYHENIVETFEALFKE